MSQSISKKTIEYIFKTIDNDYQTASNEVKNQWLNMLDLCKSNITDAAVINQIDYNIILIQSSMLKDDCATVVDDNNNTDDSDDESAKTKTPDELFNNLSDLQIIAQTYFGIDEKQLIETYDVDGLVEYYIRHDYDTALFIFINKSNYLMLGHMYSSGRGVKQNYERAMAFYQKADCAIANTYIGYMYYLGQGVKQDTDLALRYFYRAIDAGCSNALIYLGTDHRNKSSNNVRSMECYKQAASKNNSTALIEIGDMYYFSRGVDRDYAKTFEYCQKAAMMGNIRALYELGAMYYNGDYVPKDVSKSMEYYKKAADMGHLSSILKLGDMYNYGEHKNITKAVEYYEKAVKIGNKGACASLGKIYENDEQLRDYGKAMYYYKKSEDMGNSLASNYINNINIKITKSCNVEILRDKMTQLTTIVRDISSSL